jgi:hypothetical protein
MAEKTSEWWRDRLLKALVVQSDYVEQMEAWYEGMHPLPAADASNSDLYRRFQRMSQTNLLEQVVNAPATRMSVDGIRVGQSTDADEAAWEIWQRSGMDSAQTMLFPTALACGIGYISVWPDESGRPVMSPEHPGQVAHETEPGSLRDVAAAVKVYEDDAAELWHCTLWTKTEIVSWTSGGEWESWSAWKELSRESNPYGIVPMLPMLNRPTLRGSYSSEMTNGIPIQRRINQTLLNMLVAEEAVAFPQRWATGLEIQKDADGTPVRPFKSGPDSLWVSEDEGVKFGEFSESNFEGYLKAIAADVESLSAVTSTPTFALSSKFSVPPSAEALTAMESSLVKKVEAKQRLFGETIEDAFRLAFRILDDPRQDAVDAEVMWADPTIKSDAVVADWVTKAASVGVPQEALWEKLGASPQEIARWSTLSMAQAFRDLVAQVGAQQQAQQQAGPGVGDEGASG